MVETSFEIRLADFVDAHDVARIYNEAIEGRTATFETDLRSVAEMAAQISQQSQQHPTLVACEGDAVVGWAALRPYSDRACYAGIASFSVYVDSAARGRGIGVSLVASLLECARGAGHWKITSRILTGNDASRALCRRLGFREVGVHERHAQLDGRWHDVVVVERSVDASAAPPEVWTQVDRGALPAE
ncbi:MAG: arsinothricin resistance N-acetyltransferase ArsN1 family A [Mycobacteriales bacterium]